MNNFFSNINDLVSWIKKKKNGDDAASVLSQAASTINQNTNIQNDEESIKEICRKIKANKKGRRYQFAPSTLI